MRQDGITAAAISADITISRMIVILQRTPLEDGDIDAVRVKEFDQCVMNALLQKQQQQQQRQ